MLLRAFRAADKLTNAGLRVLAWGGAWLARQLFYLRLSFTALLLAVLAIVFRTASVGRGAYNATLRRQSMAQRAAAETPRTLIREDPLKSQNRVLSLFTVVLLIALIGIVLWTTNNAGTANRLPPTSDGAVALPILPTIPSPTPTLTPTASPSPVPDPLRVGGSIVYSLRVEGRENLFVLGIGMAQPLRLTNTPVDDRDPAWSPDGKRIAFTSRRDGNWELYTLDMESGALTRLTVTSGYEANPTWSPDGAFIAYEAYTNDNLDIYIIAAGGGGEPQRLTYNPAPDYAPAWGPAPSRLRNIAYVSQRDGNAEIYVISLDRPVEEEALRLTNTPTIEEKFPAWSPDGVNIAYSAYSEGVELVFSKSFNNPTGVPLTIGRGREPAWSPNSQSLVFALDVNGQTTLVGGLATGIGVASPLAISLPGRASHPHWTAAELPDSLITSGGAKPNDPPLYSEAVAPESASPPFYQFRRLPAIRAPLPVLSDRVDDSFVALREVSTQRIGYDFLGAPADLLWTRDRLPEPGQSRQSWHYAGRAFAFDRNLIFNTPAPIEIMREDIGANTYWRVYIRVDPAFQDGRLGEPLKEYPWDFASRIEGNDPAVFEQGGRRKGAIPKGYYVDFTQLAADFGWERLPSERQWRSNFPSLLYWEFDKREGLAWAEAMFELYTQAEIDAFLFGPTAIPTRTPQATPTFGPSRTPTPRPPDGG
ncbi:MAG TPA: hypothetical protein PLD47_04325 [Aggregatilineales bacterium]|nr:PD40 domain-containing protein [Anaerolineales bacterium]HRE46928.1 hypothetical protein [Aggregatilineales bacterium]